MEGENDEMIIPNSRDRSRLKNTVFLVVEPRSILHSNKIVYLQVNCFKGHNEITIEH